MSEDSASLLTNTQRNYLSGGSVSKSYERKLRHDIKDRIEASMGDFAKLFAHLDDDDVRDAFGDNFAHKLEQDENKKKELLEQAEPGDKFTEEEIEERLEEDLPEPRGTTPNSVFAVAFLLRGLNHGDYDVSEYIEKTDKEQPAFAEFIRIVESGIRLYLEREQGLHANVDVNINLSNIKPTYIEENESDN